MPARSSRQPRTSSPDAACGRSLRIGVLLGSRIINAWEARILERIGLQDGLDVVALAVSDERVVASGGLLARLESQDRRANFAERDAMAPVDVSSRYPRVPVGLGPAALAEHELDVILLLAGAV